ncbi:MAG: MFS transporter [Pseudomonadota bacterium]
MQQPRLTLIQIWNMCFGFFGIQIGFGLQNANTSRIFQTLGAEVDELAILWIAAPATGLLVQPIVGYMSDRTWGRLGRRRPYFFFGALLTTAALFVMPNSPALWIAAGTLWIMDASINITMEPFRAFVGDNLPDEQRTTGYSMQSFFIGLGAVLASALPWMLTNWFDVANTAAAGVVPDSVRIAFYVGAVCLLIAVMWTVFTSKEYSPEELDAFARARGETPEDDTDDKPSGLTLSGYIKSGAAWAFGGAALAALVARFQLEKELFLLAALLIGFGLAQWAVAALKRAKPTSSGAAGGFSEIIDDLFTMPSTMRRLAVVQFFSWFGLFAMWIYTTAGVTAHHYGATDPTSDAFNAGADWVGILFATYNGAAALAAILIVVTVRIIGRRYAHMFNLGLGAAGFLSFLFIRDPMLLWIPMIGVGFAWASILSVPYSILAGALPARKMGVYMGIFNIFIVAPQLLAATVLGALLNAFFGGQAIYAFVLGAGSFLIAAAAMLFVPDPDAPAAEDDAKNIGHAVPS